MTAKRRRNLPEPTWTHHVIGDETFTEITDEDVVRLTEVPDILRLPTVLTTAEQAALMVDEGGPVEDQTGQHDSVGPLESIDMLYRLQRSELLGDFVEPVDWPGGEDDIVIHAVAVLPHIGPRSTVAYIVGAMP